MTRSPETPQNMGRGLFSQNETDDSLGQVTAVPASPGAQALSIFRNIGP